MSIEAGCTLQQLQAHEWALREALARVELIKPCCTSCQRFDLGTCTLHGPIPNEFQKVVGECPDWAFDAIPF